MQAHADGELKPEDRSALEGWLATSAEGRSRLAEIEHVGRLVDELVHDNVDPPPFLVSRVMARVRSVDSRSSIPVRLAMRGGFDMTRKVLWTVAAVAAVALVIFTVRGFPPVDRGAEGTIGAAQRAQTQQMANNDVVVDDAAAQEFLQSDVFDRILKDESARKALADPDLRKVLADEAIARVLGNDELRNSLRSQAVRRAMDDPELRKAIDDAAIRKVLDDAAARKAFEDPAAVKKALEVPELRKAFENASLRKAMENAELRKALDDAGVRNALRNADVRAALRNDALRKALDDGSALSAAIRSNALRTGLMQRGFSAALRSARIDAELARR